MQPKAVTAALVGACAVTVCTGGAALAAGINVSPSSARRGDSVTVTGGCQGGERSPDTWATLTSDALVTTGDNINNGGFSLTTTVKDWAPLGRSTITVTCNNSKNQYKGTIFVLAGGDRDRDRRHHPHRFPRTGGGGMAAAADHPLLPMTGVAGIVLLAGAAGFGGVTVVRARARARTARERG